MGSVGTQEWTWSRGARCPALVAVALAPMLVLVLVPDAAAREGGPASAADTQGARPELSVESVAAEAGPVLVVRVRAGAPAGACAVRLDAPHTAGVVLPLRLDAEGNGVLALGGVPSGPGWTARVAGPGPGCGRAGARWSGALPLPHGLAADPPTVQRGDIVISEIQKDPKGVADARGEWIELVNLTNRTINIEGWTLSDHGSDAHRIDLGGQLLLLAAGGRVVLGIEDDPLLNGGIVMQYEYAKFTLSNGADEVLLTSRSGKLVDEVAYDDGVLWPDVAGHSLNLDPFAHDVYRNDFGGHWCPASVPLGLSDFGTPGTPNTPCP